MTELSETKKVDELTKQWTEFLEAEKKLENSHGLVCEGYHGLYEKQMANKAKIAELLKQIQPIKDLAKDNSEILTQLNEKAKTLKTIQDEILNTGGWFLELFLGRVNSAVFIGQIERRIQFKQEYEDFKYTWTLWHLPLVAFVGFVLPYLVSNQRIFDQFYQLFITYFYITLAFRENILKVNGSTIHWWWLAHHYFSLGITVIMLTWPLTSTYLMFRSRFYFYAVYTSVIQIYQYKYQKRKLYIEKTMGRASLLDVPNSDSTPIHSEIRSSFMFLLPFIFLGHAIQLWNTYWLVIEYKNIYFATGVFPEWQIIGVAAGFGIVAFGNLFTTLNVFVQKVKKPKTN
jgi:hypothetical protein